jgi:hypothetical protein
VIKIEFREDPFLGTTVTDEDAVNKARKHFSDEIGHLYVEVERCSPVSGIKTISRIYLWHFLQAKDENN